MKSSSMYITLALVCLGLWRTAQAHDMVVPAGTLMTCTLDEPRFSSATVTVGDPFLCYPRAMQQFGQTVFPRGTYIVGHLEADKEPGHFVGKGYLKLAFDRIGLPSSDVPLTAKVIAVGGYKVDREGKIIGHGHAKRDTVEWMLPPLWPWKVLTLPARGPRPTLKGETRVTLRVMEDITVPDTTQSGWHRFGERPSSYAAPEVQPVPQVRAVITTNEPNPSYATSFATMSRATVLVDPSRSTASPANVTVFTLCDGSVFPATQYWLDRDVLRYVSDGDRGRVALSSIDWRATIKFNYARGVRITLRNTPTSAE